MAEKLKLEKHKLIDDIFDEGSELHKMVEWRRIDPTAKSQGNHLLQIHIKPTRREEFYAKLREYGFSTEPKSGARTVDLGVFNHPDYGTVNGSLVKEWSSYRRNSADLTIEHDNKELRTKFIELVRKKQKPGETPKSTTRFGIGDW